MDIFKEIEKETANYNKPKASDFFRFNYYQWATPRTELEARRFGSVEAWRKQTQNIKEGSDI